MNMRPTNDPYSDYTNLVDKLIGNSYQIVRYVAMHLKTIRYVASNMESIYFAAQNQPVVVRATAGALNTTTSVNIPSGVDIADIVSSDVVIATTGDEIYTSASDTFTAWIEDGALKVNIPNTSPASMAGAQIRWTIITRKQED